MATSDVVQKYLDDIYPGTASATGIATRLGLLLSDTDAALAILIHCQRAVATQDAVFYEYDYEDSGVTKHEKKLVSSEVRYQSTQVVRSVSRNFSGSMDT